MRGVTVRPATKADEPRIRELHGEIEALLGTRMDLPAVGDPSIASWWVVEEDGVVTGGCYQEITIEQVNFGRNPRATAALIRAIPKMYAPIRAAGTRFAHCMVPKELDEQIGKHCQSAGFEPTKLVHYRMDL